MLYSTVTMPKTTGTRKQRAAELLRRVKDGPCITSYAFTPEIDEIWKRHYKLWADSWIVPALHELVPELRPEKDSNEEP